MQLRQRIDSCYFIDAYRAHHMHFDTRAGRLQPIAGNEAAPTAEYASIRLFLGEKFSDAGLEKVAMQ